MLAGRRVPSGSGDVDHWRDRAMSNDSGTPGDERPGWQGQQPPYPGAYGQQPGAASGGYGQPPGYGQAGWGQQPGQYGAAQGASPSWTGGPAGLSPGGMSPQDEARGFFG